MRKLLILILLTASICWGQAATLMTIPHQHFHDNSGNLCASCTVTTYTASTSTPTSTYTSKTGLVTNANPITLNSRGEPTSDGVSASSIYIKAGTCLKLVLKDSAGTTISTEDGICSDPASPVSLTANNAGGYGWSLTQSSGTGGGVNIIPGADSGMGEEALRIRNAANNATEVQCWGNGNCTLTGTISAAIGTITGNATIGGTLGVTGAATFGAGVTVTGNVTRTGAIGGSAAATISGAVPSVATGNMFVVTNGGATNMTGMTGIASFAQVVTLYFSNGNTTLIHNAGTFALRGAANSTPAAGGSVTFMKTTSADSWVEIARNY